MSKYKNLTVFFVSYFSSSNIKKVLKKIDPSVKVLIIDNAKEKKLNLNMPCTWILI